MMATAASKPLLEVKGLQMHFPVTEGIIVHRKIGEVKAVDGIDFVVKLVMKRRFRCVFSFGGTVVVSFRLVALPLGSSWLRVRRRDERNQLTRRTAGSRSS